MLRLENSGLEEQSPTLTDNVESEYLHDYTYTKNFLWRLVIDEESVANS